nr:DUF4825 domain-containing protein [uncultured Oscillibacter sp.]
MKNDLTCGVVRDLLPSYIEGLLGEDSRKAVDRHLESCPACTAQKEAMAAMPRAEEAEETAKEVNYLKRVKKGTAKKIVLAVACTALVLLGGAALKLFVIGTPLQPQSVAVAVADRQDNNTLYLSLSSVGSGNAFHGWKVETVDGVTSIYARDVLASPLYSSGQAELSVPLNFVREVWLGGTTGRLLWADGLVISRNTMDLLDAKTPYCGDAPALGRIAELLQISRVMGPYTTTLHTSSEPYVWALEFQEEFGEGDLRQLRYYAYQMLALVENLDKIAYVYEPEAANGRTREERLQRGTVSAQNAARLLAGLTEKYNQEHNTDWPIHESVKEYAESPLEYQRMVTLLTEHLIYRY